jgi:hypothetical protein
MQLTKEHHLPTPFGPINTTNWPPGTSKLTWLKTGFTPWW